MMNMLNNNNMDKIKHFAVGLIIGILTLPLSHFMETQNAYYLIMVIATLIFVGKEAFDIKTSGFNFADLWFDYLGLAVGIASIQHWL